VISSSRVTDTLTSLWSPFQGKVRARQEILDVLYRYCRAFDRVDQALLASTYHPDAFDDHGGFYSGPATGFIDLMPKLVEKSERTFHVIMNVLIEFDSTSSANVESYSLAFARVVDADTNGRFDRCTQLRYVDRFERRAGKWRIAKRVAVYDSARTEPVNEYTAEFPPRTLRGTRDRSDPSYSSLHG
jgi:hypothetical protein